MEVMFKRKPKYLSKLERRWEEKAKKLGKNILPNYISFVDGVSNKIKKSSKKIIKLTDKMGKGLENKKQSYLKTKKKKSPQ